MRGEDVDNGEGAEGQLGKESRRQSWGDEEISGWEKGRQRAKFKDDKADKYNSTTPLLGTGKRGRRTIRGEIRSDNWHFGK